MSLPTDPLPAGALPVDALWPRTIRFVALCVLEAAAGLRERAEA